MYRTHHIVIPLRVIHRTRVHDDSHGPQRNTSAIVIAILLAALPRALALFNSLGVGLCRDALPNFLGAGLCRDALLNFLGVGLCRAFSVLGSAAMPCPTFSVLCYVVLPRSAASGVPLRAAYCPALNIHVKRYYSYMSCNVYILTFRSNYWFTGLATHRVRVNIATLFV
jgi:hypothetical protein